MHGVSALAQTLGFSTGVGAVLLTLGSSPLLGESCLPFFKIL